MTNAQEPNLTRYAWLSIAAALTTIGLKAAAWRVTGSVGLLSDAMESMVNLAAAVVALWALKVAAEPPDEEHPHGHDKAEYFSSGIEGALIFVAAVLIVISAVPRLMAPRPLESVGLGLGVSVLATIVNLVVGRLLIRVGRKRRSIALEADGHHLMTDVWTSVGVLVGVGLVEVSGLLILDPIVAIAVACNILWMGYRLIKRSGHGLMDTSLPPDERQRLAEVLDGFRGDGALWHALRTRQAGSRRFASVHVLVPGAWTVLRAHDLVERVEEAMRAALPSMVVTTHLEPIEDARSWTDQTLEPEAAPDEPTA